MITFIAGVLTGALGMLATLVLIGAWDDRSGTADPWDDRKP
jgi:hypothetical protein